MPDFFGRAAELHALDRSYDAKESSFIPIYGRRRVGKTALIREFLDGKANAIYVVGQQSPGPQQLRDLLRVAADALSAPLLARISVDGWKDALRAIAGARRGKAKLILVLDEYQWLVESSPELPSVLQALWDHEWADSGHVMLILCGSYVGFMEREVLGSKSPLFGRRTGQILLRPFGYREASLFHPSYSLVDRARTYFICGGIPLYLRAFSAARSVEMNIAEAFLDEYAPLNREAEFLLREELRDLANYHAILTRLAERPMSLTEIGSAAGLGHNVQYHLQQLMELGYVARRFPLSGESPSKRSVRYALEDPLLRFWFRFVYPNQSFLSFPGPEATFAEKIRPGLDAYFGSCFERLCREALPNLYAHERVDTAFEVGEFWSRDVQIDVVGVRHDGWIDLGECKWGAAPSVKALARELEEKVAAFPNPANATIARRAFTRGRVRASSVPGVMWHSLDDLYAAAPVKKRRVPVPRTSRPAPRKRRAR
jgi:uncharacterized protein